MHRGSTVNGSQLKMLLKMIADSSNYINQKKIEINRKQERARILMDEFVTEAVATCQGKDKDILRDPGAATGSVRPN